MSDRIELTEDETYAAAKAIFPDVIWADDRATLSATSKVVERVVEAVNEIRAGDPVGTIRRSVVRHEFYERIEDTRGRRSWATYTPAGVFNGIPVGADAIVYRPDGAA